MQQVSNTGSTSRRGDEETLSETCQNRGKYFHSNYQGPYYCLYPFSITIDNVLFNIMYCTVYIYIYILRTVRLNELFRKIFPCSLVS